MLCDIFIIAISIKIDETQKCKQPLNRLSLEHDEIYIAIIKACICPWSNYKHTLRRFFYPEDEKIPFYIMLVLSKFSSPSQTSNEQ